MGDSDAIWYRAKIALVSHESWCLGISAVHLCVAEICTAAVCSPRSASRSPEGNRDRDRSRGNRDDKREATVLCRIS